MQFPNPLPHLKWLGCVAVLATAQPAQAQLSAAPATTTPAANPAATLALSYLRAHAGQFVLSDADLATVVVTAAYADGPTGPTHAYLLQRLDGEPVAGTEVGLHFDAQGQLLTRTGAFAGSLRSRVAQLPAPAVSAEAATTAALRHLARPGARVAEAARRVYLRQPDGALLAAWQLALRPAQGPDYWTVRVDAATGRVLRAANRVVREPLPKRRGAAALPVRPAAPAADARRGSQRPAVANSYRVFAMPLESPLHGAPSVQASPADAVASPFGWHDTNGVAGPEYTITRGNNAHAYERGSTSAPGFAPDGGPNLEFDFPFDATRSYRANQPAALTNAFYWTNLLHDLSQRYGFTEAAGNYQQTNYSGQGAGDDYLRTVMTDQYADAYFEPTPDGVAIPRFPAMYLGPWQVPLENALVVTAPAAAARSYNVLPAQFGSALPYPGTLSGNLVLVNDGSSTPTAGCQTPWVNAAQVSGNIVVLEDTYNCEYTELLRNAQAAGARAAVLIGDYDFLVSLYYNPADTTGLRIPMVSVTSSDGQRLKAALQNGATAAARLGGVAPAPDRNGCFENGIVAHEYAHGITLRLTGGPAGATACLDNPEQMGEGWSDFFELWTTTRPGDVGTTPRGLGTYVLGQPTTGPGIRPLPYTTNMALNNTTYGFIGRVVNGVDYGPYDASSPEPYDSHNTGLVWCSVLWDLNWALVQRYGYDANLLTGTGGNNKAMRLVMDGLKLQPCSPGFLDGRDAILAADRAAFGGANQALIWQVFARRGMGADAVQGSSSSLTDNTAGFALPAGLATAPALAAAALDLYPNPTQGLLTLRLAAPNAAPVAVEVHSALGQRVRTFALPAAAAASGVPLDLRGLAPGVYVLRVRTAAGTLARRVVVQP